MKTEELGAMRSHHARIFLEDLCFYNKEAACSGLSESQEDGVGLRVMETSNREICGREKGQDR